MSEILITDLTTGTLAGTGVFDKLMQVNKEYLEDQFNKGRIKGPEYATVYLGVLDSVMSQSMQFLLQKQAIALQADLLAQQIILAGIEVQKAQIALQLLELEKTKSAADIEQVRAQTQLTLQQKINLVKELDKADAEIAQVHAQTEVTTQQKLNLAAEVEKTIAELALIPKQGLLLDQQVLNAISEVQKTAAEVLNIPKQGQLVDAQVNQSKEQTKLIDQQGLNLIAEAVNIPKQGALLDAQICKLQAEFDLTVNTNTKTSQETALLTQKTATERAQTMATGVDPDSVVGKQKALYQAQTDGFARDAEQKAAKLLVDTWSARRMSDEGTVADGVNMLNDAVIGRAVNKVLAGVGA